MNIIGNKIRQLQEAKGFSQEVLATELGLTQASYTRLEKVDERISIIRLMEISRISETSVSEIINENIAKVINQ
jgi:transcriptional regulator with XRE-family HTH domain